MSSQASVPYFVLLLENNNNQNDSNALTPSSSCRYAKALFTVPTELAVALTAYPILCRGSAFELKVDAYASAESTPPTQGSSGNQTTFLTTLLESPYPEDAAKDIARRLAMRIDNIDTFQVATANGASQFFLGI